MENRKDQLQKQIIEALKVNDNDLYSLLKSQWAHRFGVESLEELNNLNLNEENLSLKKEDKLRNDQLEENPLEVDEEISMKVENCSQEIKEKEFTDHNQKVIKSNKVEKKVLIGTKSYEIADKKNYENIGNYSVSENKSPPKLKALIPLPPIPKYGYLKKWLLRGRF